MLCTGNSNTSDLRINAVEGCSGGIVVDYNLLFITLRSNPKPKRIIFARFSTRRYVNEQIKSHQPEGLWGARHIQRTPFEACAIPIFEKDDPDHQELARLSMTAHERIEEMKGMEENRLLNGGPGRARKAARDIVASEIIAIDEIARRIIAE